VSAEPITVLTVGNMYPPHHLGGAELIWRSAVEHMRGLGWRVRVLASDWRAPEPDPAFAEDPDIARALPWYWEEHHFPKLGARERLRIERDCAAILGREIETVRPDAICWWSMGGMSMSMLQAPARAGIPALGVLLDEWLVYGPAVDGWERLCRRLGPVGPALARLARIPALVDLGAVAEWIFMSETLRRHAAEAGVDTAGSSVVYRGIDLDRFEAGPEPAEWGGELLCLGRIDPRKGIAVAIRALAEPALADCGLRVVGDGDRAHLAELEALARDLGLGDRVRFERVPGDAVPGILAAADALLFAVQWEEPWGLVPLEAMAAGTAVVATGTGGSGEYLSDGDNCLIYAPRDDPAALAAAVARLRDMQLRAKLRAGGLETAGRFSERGFNEGVAERIAAAARGGARR